MSAAAVGRRTARRNAVFALYQHDLTGGEVEGLLQEQARGSGRVDPYTEHLVHAVCQRRDELDALIAAAAVDWSVQRMAPLDRNILRVAVHEITGGDDVPVAVAIDEAVQLAKRFSQAEAPAFVNGILGTIARSHGGA